MVTVHVNFRITPAACISLQRNSDFMNKIRVNDIILVIRPILLEMKVISALVSIGKPTAVSYKNNYKICKSLLNKANSSNLYPDGENNKS